MIRKNTKSKSKKKPKIKLDAARKNLSEKIAEEEDLIR